MRAPQADLQLTTADAANALRVSAALWHDALAACHEAIDALKQLVPLWKKQVYERGEEWIGWES